jgi:outer membrane biosynthesis protein TonB
MRPGFTISTAFHAVVLGWGLIHFASVRPNEAPPVDSLPIDLVDISDITKTKQGNVKAEKKPDVEKQVEKQADPTPKVDPNLPVKNKEVKSAPPPPTPTPPEKVEPKEEPKKEAVTPDTAPSPDAIAKKLEEEKKKVEKKKETPKKVAEKAPPVKSKHNFDPDKIAELLDRRAPSRKQNSGETKSNTNFGVPKGNDTTLSASEIDAFRRQVEKCWNVLPGAGNLDRSRVELRIMFNPDGTLASQPQIYRAATGPNAQTTSESAVRAVINCGPYKMFKAQTYASWKDMIVGFEPNSSSY